MNLIYIFFICPLLGLFFLLLSDILISKKLSVIINIFLVFIVWITSIYIIYIYRNFFINIGFFYFPLWNWIKINHYNIEFGLLIDSLSLSMLGIVTFISFLIYFFSFFYMYNDVGLIRYFIYMNLFVFFMLFYVLSNNLIFMFFTWELIGVCSYLLIGFYYKNINSGYSAIKSFLMTRFGDLFFLFAIFLTFFKFNTVNFYELNNIIQKKYIFYHHDKFLFFITLFLLIGIIGKSVQVPLHTWLINAMVGPTPASALLHSTTMVVSGVYLLLRVYSLFVYNLDLMYLLGIVGCITFIISSFNAIFEKDIKRILAYSTMSQVGYMFLSLGTFNPVNTIIHLICHAFFKSLLFLSSGFIISYMKNEQNIFKMSKNLYKKIPIVYLSFFIGILSLVSFPFITSTFYSKGNILWFSYYHKHIEFLILGIIGTFLTSVYAFRMFFLIFHNNNFSSISCIKYNFFYNFPFFILSLACTPLIWFILSHYFYISYISENYNGYEKFYIECISSVFSILGIIYSYFFYFKKMYFFKTKVINKKIYNFFIYIRKEIYFDRLYEDILVKYFTSFFLIFINDPCNKIMGIFTKIFFYLMFYKLKFEHKNFLWHIKYFIFVWFFIFFFFFLII